MRASVSREGDADPKSSRPGAPVPARRGSPLLPRFRRPVRRARGRQWPRYGKRGGPTAGRDREPLDRNGLPPRSPLRGRRRRRAQAPAARPATGFSRRQQLLRRHQVRQGRVETARRRSSPARARCRRTCRSGWAATVAARTHSSTRRPATGGPTTSPRWPTASRQIRLTSLRVAGRLRVLEGPPKPVQTAARLALLGRHRPEYGVTARPALERGIRGAENAPGGRGRCLSVARQLPQLRIRRLAGGAHAGRKGRIQPVQAAGARCGIDPAPSEPEPDRAG